MVPERAMASQSWGQAGRSCTGRGYGRSENHPMFASEAAGLEELRQANAVRVPQVRSVGRNGAHAWLALEWIQFTATATATESALGERLALQHRHAAAAFGF